jgi:hypothetical protein
MQLRFLKSEVNQIKINKQVGSKVIFLTLAIQGEYVGCYQYQGINNSPTDLNFLINNPSAADSPTSCLTQCRQLQYK